MSNLNKKMILLSGLLSAVILFGGWYSYQYYGLEKPLLNKIEQLEGVELQDLQVEQDRVDVLVTFKEHPSFGQTYLQLDQMLQKEHKGKEIQINIDHDQGDVHPWWLRYSDSYIELVENKQYTALKKQIQDHIEEGHLQDGQVMMNKEYIFLHFQPVEQYVQNKENEVYIILITDQDQIS